MDILTELLSTDFLGKAAWIWLVFVGVVVALLALDLGVLHKHDREVGVRERLLLRLMAPGGRLESVGYTSIAVLSGAWVWWFTGAQGDTEYFTGHLMEKSLSMDNVNAVFSVGLIGTTPAASSLSLTVGLIAAGVACSRWRTRNPTGPNTLTTRAVPP